MNPQIVDEVERERRGYEARAAFDKEVLNSVVGTEIFEYAANIVRAVKKRRACSGPCAAFASHECGSSGLSPITTRRG